MPKEYVTKFLGRNIEIWPTSGLFSAGGVFFGPPCIRIFEYDLYFFSVILHVFKQTTRLGHITIFEYSNIQIFE